MHPAKGEVFQQGCTGSQVQVCVSGEDVGYHGSGAAQLPWNAPGCPWSLCQGGEASLNRDVPQGSQ